MRKLENPVGVIGEFAFRGQLVYWSLVGIGTVSATTLAQYFSLTIVSMALAWALLRLIFHPLYMFVYWGSSTDKKTIDEDTP